MEVGLVQKVNIDDEMQQAYLDYAMSVIVARALPDARDGLKPVHRRILYAMYDMGMRPDTPYKKSARIVGEVLGKYHPHGDMAVYDAMARMAQDFSMRYLMVDGQGNFGSIDGDPPAAMRYTEARLHSPALQMLVDLNKNTVDFTENFDGTLKEPDVLPAAIPNLLVNGATGIAVGMSTSIPPHNLGEVVDALGFMLESWEKLDDLPLESLMQFIHGPDFPTGGVIIQEPHDDGISNAYGTGRGRVVVQARVHLEEMERGRSRLIVTELPYMTNKSSLMERIALLVREERLEGISDLRDESDRHGMRIVIELSKTADPEKMLKELFKNTPMQSTFNIIMLALVEGEPRMLGLKQALRVYLEHRLEIVRRRSQYDLEKARQRAHILEGLRIALHNLDEIIALIRKAPDAETARQRLIKQYKLTEIQATAILDMQLRRLASLERKKIEEEYKEVQALIKELESLLRSPKKMREVVNQELQDVKAAFSDPRRTQIVTFKEGEPRHSLLTSQALTPEKRVWVTITPDGLIARLGSSQLPDLSGSNAPASIIQASSRDTLYVVNEQGEAASLLVHTLPEADSPSAGLPYWKATPLKEGTRPAGMFTWQPKNGDTPDWYVMTATRQGMVKKSLLVELPGASANTFTLVRVNPGDRLAWVGISRGQEDVLLVTQQGMSIRFSEEEVRPMGLVAAGVMGMKLQEKDELAGAAILPSPAESGSEIFLIAGDGTAKRVALAEFVKQGRYGQGVVAWKLPADTRVKGIAPGVSGRGKAKNVAFLHLENEAARPIHLEDAPQAGRAARGHRLSGLKSGQQVKGLVAPWRRPGLPDLPAADLSPMSGGPTGSTSNGHQDGKVKPAPVRDGSAKAKTAKATAQVDGNPKKAAAKSTKAAAPPEPAQKAATQKGGAEASAKGAKKPAVKAEPVKPPAKAATKAAPAAATKKSAAKKTEPAPKKAPAKKAAVAKSAPAKSAPAKAAPAKTTPAKTAPAPEKATAKKAKTVPEAVPTKKAPAPETGSSKKAPAKSAEKSSAPASKAKKTPGEKAPAEKAPAKTTGKSDTAAKPAGKNKPDTKAKKTGAKSDPRQMTFDDKVK